MLSHVAQSQSHQLGASLPQDPQCHITLRLCLLLASPRLSHLNSFRLQSHMPDMWAMFVPQTQGPRFHTGKRWALHLQCLIPGKPKPAPHLTELWEQIRGCKQTEAIRFQKLFKGEVSISFDLSKSEMGVEVGREGWGGS